MPIRPSRYPSRASEDKELIYSVLDAGLFCTIAFNLEGVPHQIPTGYCRINDELFIHGSAKSHFIDSIIGQTVSFSVSLVDDLILAPTAFDHSFNYRSVIGFSEGVEVVDEKAKMEFLRVFTDRYIPGRMEDVGDPSSDEVKITKVIQFSLDKVAVKIREGDVGIKNLQTDKWTGVIPVIHKYGKPQIDPQMENQVELPDYIKNIL
ncbi:MAG: pyridoxamine 5'-phosphate oxidase family protein [Cytophagales bacterium]|nr:pyridoxamine 5'-phosphate oxidase family protein [Cytophagales bacterium]